MKSKFAIFIFTLAAMLCLTCCQSGGTDDGTTTTTGEVTTTTNTESSKPVCESHTFGEWYLNSPASCVKDGENLRVCSVCSYKERQSIPATGHTLEKIEAVAPTCSAEGKSEGQRCTVCTRIITIPQKVAKLPHNLNNENICTDCGHHYYTAGLVFTLNEDKGSYSVRAGSCSDEEVFIPAYYEGLPVVRLNCVSDFGHSYFDNTTKSLTLPETMRSLDAAAFCYFDDSVFTEYNGGLYLGSGSNPYYALIKLKDESISSLTLHSDTAVIADDIFADNKALTSVALSEKLVRIPEEVFRNCSNLKTVTIPSAEEIADWAFSNCSLLESVTLPSNCKTLGYHAFDGCSSLHTLTLNDGLETISNSVISGTKVGEIVIPDSVKRVEHYAFERSGLKRVVLGSGTQIIYTTAFDMCNLLEEIVISSTFEKFSDSDVFPLFQSLKKFVVHEDNPYYMAKDGVLYSKDGKILINYPKKKESSSFTIPSTVTTVGYQAFYNCQIIESLKMSDSVTDIEAQAFYNCQLLEDVTFSKNLKNIGDQAFYMCALSEITLPESVENIGYSSFDVYAASTYGDNDTRYIKSAGNPYFALIKVDTFATEITVHPDTVIIAGNTFNRASCKSVTLGNKLISIGSNAFSGSPLTSIVIPDSVKYIGYAAFASCKSLESAVLPKDLVYIGDKAFNYCELIESFDLPEGLSHIGASAFAGCKKLKSIVIPHSVTYLGEYAFNLCSVLESVTFEGTLDAIPESCFERCLALTAIVIPEGVTSIGSSAFMTCENLKTVILPDSVRLIDSNAFRDCKKLSSIVIPAGVTAIRNDAFLGCSALTRVYYGGADLTAWQLIEMTDFDKTDSPVSRAARYYYSEEKPDASGKFWHLVDGVVTVW